MRFPLLTAFSLVVVACGGGGGGGGQPVAPAPPEPPEPPPPVADTMLVITEDNGQEVLETALAVGELAALLANVGVTGTEFIVYRRDTEVEWECLSGLRLHTLNDIDEDAKPSPGDTVSTTYEDCSHFPFHGWNTIFTQGQVDYELSDIVFSDTRDEYMNGIQRTPTDILVRSTTVLPIRPGRIVTDRFFVGGSFRMTYTTSSVNEVLSVDTEDSGELRITNDRFVDTATELSLHRELNFSAHSFDFSFRFRSESLEGTFGCTAEEISGSVNSTPSAGRLVCTGRDESAVEIALKEDKWVISVDQDGDGTFDEVSNSEGWPFPRMDNLYEALGEGGVESPQDYRSLDVEESVSLDVTDAVYSSETRKVYVANGDGIVIWNPETFEIEQTISLEDKPGVLALSQDETNLYVGYADTSRVDTVELESLNVVAMLELTERSRGRSSFAVDIEEVLGEPGVLVVSSGRDGEVAVYDDGVRRPNVVEFTDTIGYVGGKLYSYDNKSSASGLAELEVNAAGVFSRGELRGFLQGFEADFFDVRSRIVGSLGRVVDFSEQAVLGEMDGGLQRELRPLSDPSFGINGVFDAGSGQVYFLRKDKLISYDADRMVPTSLYHSPLSDEPVGLILTDSRFVLLGASEIVTVKKESVVPYDLEGCDTSVWVESSTFYDSTARQYTCTINDAVYDPGRHKIYASVPSSVGVNGNSIAVMDPDTALVERFIPVGSEPTGIEMTGDGHGLLVGFDGQNAIAEVDLVSERVVTIRPIRPGTIQEPQFAFRFASSPIRTDHWLALIADGGDGYYSHPNLYRFSDGVVAPNSAYAYQSVLFAPDDPSLAYSLGYDDFSTFSIDQDGVSKIDELSDVIRGYRLYLANDKIYTDGGQRIDPESLSVEMEFETEGGIVSVDEERDHVYFFSPLFETLTVFDDSTGDQLATYKIPASLPRYTRHKALLAEIPGVVFFAHANTLLVLPKSEIVN